jgi:ribosomal protein L29
MATAKKPVAAKTPAKPVDIKSLSGADLVKKVAELRVEAAALKRGMREGNVQNVRAYTAKRRDIARALTALNAKAEGEEK